LAKSRAFAKPQASVAAGGRINVVDNAVSSFAYATIRALFGFGVGCQRDLTIGRVPFVTRYSIYFSLVLALCLGIVSRTATVRAQEPTPTTAPAKKPDSKAPAQVDLKNPTGEMITEGVILVYGGGSGRALLNQIRRNGIERGRTSRVQPDGRIEEERYELRFVRGDAATKDKIRIDRKTPQVEYSLVYGQDKLFGIVNGSPFTPREDAAADFLNERTHGIDALLRYKENGSTMTLVRKDKAQGVEFYLVDLTDKEKRVTHYYVSTRSFRVLWLEYEESPRGAAAPIKYQRRFHDYRVAQGTLVPFRSTLLQDGKQTSETRILTVTYGAKMEDSVFQHPDQAAASNP